MRAGHVGCHCTRAEPPASLSSVVRQKKVPKKFVARVSDHIGKHNLPGANARAFRPTKRMKTTPLLLAIAVLAAIFPTTGIALTVERAVTPASLREHPKEFSVSVRKDPNGLLAFTVVHTLSEPKHLVAHLRVRQQSKTIAESHTPALAKTGDNIFYFSILPEHVADSRFEIGESFAPDGVPVPGTVIYQFRIRDFVPEDLLKSAATE
jgi:hypothetical protein